MVVCPKGTPSQIKANAEAFEKSKRHTYESSDSVSWIYVPSEEREESQGKQISSDEFDYDVIKADERCPPTVEDEVVYSFVVQLLDILTDHWEGRPCLKPKVEAEFEVQCKKESEKFGDSDEISHRISSQSIPNKEELEDVYQQRHQKLSKEKIADDSLGRKATQKEASKTNGKEPSGRKASRHSEEQYPWKIFIPDEDVHTLFSNGAWYEGRVSRRLMEGFGTYFWEGGAIYQGDFIGGTATNFGRLEFPDQSVYEGYLYKSYRHGEGLQCMYDSPVMYSGEWWLGKKHGQGLIVYDEPSKSINFYKGNWESGYKNGFGFRHYPSGAKYIGYWKNGKRHGNGIMMWTNHDIYKGQWENGLMHGYGEYTWNGLLNNNLAYPAENKYRGYWAFGKRNGTGILETKHGATIETEWVDNIKHGSGCVVCSDGSIVSSEKLFKNNNQALLSGEDDPTGMVIRNKIRSSCKTKYHVQDNRKGFDDIKLLSYLNSPERNKAIGIKIHIPPHQIDLSPYLSKLNVKRNSLTSADFESGSQGRDRSGSVLRDIKSSGEWENYLQQEEKFLRFEIIRYMCQLRRLYDEYATLTYDENPPYKCILSRLFLRQLLVDRQIHNRGISMIEMDCKLGEKHLLLEDLHSPFEKIQFWQFLHILILLSWHLYGIYIYTPTRILQHERVTNFLEYFNLHHEKFVFTRAFHYFLENDIFNDKAKFNSGTSIANLCKIVPMEAMHNVYQQIGVPHSVRDFLTKICPRRDQEDKTPEMNEYFESLPSYKANDKDHKVSVATQLVQIQDKPSPNADLFLCQNASTKGIEVKFTCFNALKPNDIIKCLSKICPGIVVDDDIVNVDYQLTFFEFCHAIVLCSELSLKKEAMDQLRPEIISKYKSDLEEYEKQLLDFEKQSKRGTATSKRGSSIMKKGRK